MDQQASCGIAAAVIIGAQAGQFIQERPQFLPVRALPVLCRQQLPEFIQRADRDPGGPEEPVLPRAIHHNEACHHGPLGQLDRIPGK